jgi:hypothetical protein
MRERYIAVYNGNDWWEIVDTEKRAIPCKVYCDNSYYAERLADSLNLTSLEVLINDDEGGSETVRDTHK